MTPSQRPAILCVDDDRHLLEGLTRLLHRQFNVATASGGSEALETLEAHGAFDVIVCDMQMPIMNGIELLRRARDLAPHTVRVLLTGQANLQAAIDAVNEGHLYRFLTKPCHPRVLRATLSAAVEQRQLLISEQVLLERTLHGSIRTLTELLALSQPSAFGRASRARADMTDLAASLGIEDRWLLEIAAMLSQIGCITLPPETAARVYAGEHLSPGEAQMVERLPAVTAELLSNIPRLEAVQEILLYQQKQFDGCGVPGDRVYADAIPWGARALKISIDFDVLIAQGLSAPAALRVMHDRTGWYDPAILEAFTDLRSNACSDGHVEDVRLSDVRPGMTFAEDLYSLSGALLVARGQEVTVSLAARLRNLDLETVATTTARMVVTPRSERTSPIAQRLLERQAVVEDPIAVPHDSNHP